MIGIFDSGIGGVQTLRYIRALLPDQNYFFLADTAHLPYGDKSPDRIRQRMMAILEYMFKQGCNIVIIACNTAAASSVRYRQEHHPDRKVLSVTIPGIEALVGGEYTHAALFATQSTVGTGIYQELAYRHGRSGMIDPYPLTDLVLAIESQNTNKQEVIIRHTIQSLQSETDVVILGCTHFPIIRSIIYQYTNLPLIDPGYEAAQQLVHYFDRHSDYMISTQHPHISYTVTGNPNQFAHSMQQIFDIESEVSRREI